MSYRFTRRALIGTGAAIGVATVLGAPEARASTAPMKAMAAALPPALFIGAHPDDLTISMGVTITEHLAAGQDVHCLIMTPGQKSGALAVINGTTVSSYWGVMHDPVAEGYAPLTGEEFGQARIREERAALACMKAGMPGTLSIWEGNLIDGQVTQPLAYAAMRNLFSTVPALSGAVRLKTHSNVIDDHPDHLAIGKAIVQLHDEDATRWGDKRHYIGPGYWGSDPRNSQVTGLSWDLPTNNDIKFRARNACRVFFSKQPAEGVHGIGAESKSDWLTTVMNDPKCKQHN